MINLKSCPFCGGEAMLLRNAKRKIYGKDAYRIGVAVCCGVCEARMFYGSEKLAIEAWNRRSVENIDPINRQAAINALDGEITITGEDNIEVVQKYIRNVSKKIRDLPSVQLKQKKGKWISIFDEEESKCSECGKAYYYPTARKYYFCPNCGADMGDNTD